MDSPRHLIAGGLVFLAAALFAAVGLTEPAALGWPGPTPLWGRVGLILLLYMPVAWLLAVRAHLRSLWVLRNEPPVGMYVEVERQEDSDSMSYYACLRAAPGEAVLHRVPIRPPGADVGALHLPHAAKVFIDSESGKPLVIETQGRRSWAIVG